MYVLLVYLCYCLTNCSIVVFLIGLSTYCLSHCFRAVIICEFVIDFVWYTSPRHCLSASLSLLLLKLWFQCDILHRLTIALIRLNVEMWCFCSVVALLSQRFCVSIRHLSFTHFVSKKCGNASALCLKSVFHIDLSPLTN